MAKSSYSSAASELGRVSVEHGVDPVVAASCVPPVLRHRYEASRPSAMYGASYVDRQRERQPTRKIASRRTISSMQSPIFIELPTAGLAVSLPGTRARGHLPAAPIHHSRIELAVRTIRSSENEDAQRRQRAQRRRKRLDIIPGEVQRHQWEFGDPGRYGDATAIANVKRLEPEALKQSGTCESLLPEMLSSRNDAPQGVPTTRRSSASKYPSVDQLIVSPI